MLTYVGKVLCVPVKTFNVQCNGDLVKYPYDTQTCAIEIDLLPYTTSEIKIGTYETDINSYEQNPEWKLLDVSNVAEQRWNPNTNTSYQLAAYKITIQRHSTYHNIVIMLPAVGTC